MSQLRAVLGAGSAKRVLQTEHGILLHSRATFDGGTVDEATRTPTVVDAGDAGAPNPSHASRRERPKDTCSVLMRELENKFTASIFFTEVPYQLTMPLSLPIYLYHRGWTAARNQLFVFDAASSRQGKLGSIIFSWIMPLISFSLAAAAIFGHIDEWCARTNIMRSEMVMPFALHAIHKLCVSTKYAYLTPQEYTRFLRVTDEARVARWRTQLQVLSGWVRSKDFAPSLDVTTSELEIAFVRNAIRLGEDYSLSYKPEHAAAWRRFLGSGAEIAERSSFRSSSSSSSSNSSAEEPGTANTGGKVSLSQLLHTIALTSHPFNPSTPTKVAYVIAWLRALAVPCSHRMLCGEGEHRGFFPPANEMLGSVVVTLGVIVTVPMGVTCLSFMTGALLHYARKHEMIATLGKLTRLSLATSPDEPEDAEALGLPIICMSCANNVRAWMYAREVVHDFGMRYEVRIGTYVLFTTAGAAVGLFYGFARVVETSTRDAGEELACDPVMWYMLFDLSWFAPLLFLIIGAAAATNSLVHTQVARLLKHRVRLRDAKTNDSFSDKVNQEDCDDLLATGVQALTAQQNSDPISIAGFEATQQLRFTILTLTAYVLSAVGQTMITGSTSVPLIN
jgi:hypothetical protein